MRVLQQASRLDGEPSVATRPDRWLLVHLFTCIHFRMHVAVIAEQGPDRCKVAGMRTDIYRQRHLALTGTGRAWYAWTLKTSKHDTLAARLTEAVREGTEEKGKGPREPLVQMVLRVRSEAWSCSFGAAAL